MSRVEPSVKRRKLELANLDMSCRQHGDTSTSRTPNKPVGAHVLAARDSQRRKTGLNSKAELKISSKLSPQSDTRSSNVNENLFGHGLESMSIVDDSCHQAEVTSNKTAVETAMLDDVPSRSNENVVRLSGRLRRRPRRYSDDSIAEHIAHQTHTANDGLTWHNTEPKLKPTDSADDNAGQGRFKTSPPTLAVESINAPATMEVILGRDRKHRNSRVSYHAQHSPRGIQQVLSTAKGYNRLPANHSLNGNPDMRQATTNLDEKKFGLRQNAQAPKSWKFQNDPMPEHLLRNVALDRLMGRRLTPIVGYDEEILKISQLLEHTVNTGEGNSLLLIGARGSGKTAIMTSILEKMSKAKRGNFYTIKLNGFLQADDKSALREIWRQLGKEMDVATEPGGLNYADTMAKLLATLSSTPQLVQGQPVCKSIVFILDEFERFTAYPRQTLLYNLFDIAQARKAPIAVVGLTTAIDISERLEKRVKSRFSHRYVHISAPKTFSALMQICKAALHVSVDDLSPGELIALASVTQLQVSTSWKDDRALRVIQEWNERVEALLTNATVERLIAETFQLNKSVSKAFNVLVAPVSHLQIGTSKVWSSSDKYEAGLAWPDSKLSLLPLISPLSLFMLVACARMEIILDSEACNFNMAYDEYCNLAARSRSSASLGPINAALAGRVWSREAARATWDYLLLVQLLIPVSGTGTVGTRDSGGSGEMVRSDVALEEIEGAVPDFDRNIAQWCRAI